MAALNIKIMQESPVFKRKGCLPCKILALNLGADPEEPKGSYATAVKVFPKGQKPYFPKELINLNQVYKDFEQRMIIFGG